MAEISNKYNYTLNHIENKLQKIINTLNIIVKILENKDSLFDNKNLKKLSTILNKQNNTNSTSSNTLFNNKEEKIYILYIVYKSELYKICHILSSYKYISKSILEIFKIFIKTILNRNIPLNFFYRYKINNLLNNFQTESPFDCYLKNYISNKIQCSNTHQSIDYNNITPFAFIIGTKRKNIINNYSNTSSSFNEKVHEVHSEPSWAPEWYQQLVTNNPDYNDYWKDIESLFAPLYRSLTALQEREREKARAQQRNRQFSALLTQLVRLLQARSESLNQCFLFSDSMRAGYPPLDEGILRDPLRGHWELWPAVATAETQVMAVEDGLMARNPMGDVQNFPVCIDFGTCSTVVALRERGRKRLLRVGVRDWRQAPRALHFENPTALEFVDMRAFGKAWQAEEWRPHVTWQTLKCSHQAREEILSAPDAVSVYGGMTDIKSWARQNAHGTDTKLQDQQGTAFLLSPGVTKEQASDSLLSFNPLEIYAFHLGLAINSQYRENGRIYTDYYLSFPVTFDTPTRQCILRGFQRGLERSLPTSLTQQEAWRNHPPLCVHTGADEPVAYAAGILMDSGLEPDEDGLPFGVFDFGGGTTDFAFGLYRWATPAEEASKGWESVIQLLDVAGEPLLGGEVLLHLLCFELICNNLNSLLTTGSGIPFLLPAGKVPPTGGESIFTDSLPARSNTIRLCEALRPLWEDGKTDFAFSDEGILRVSLLDRSGADMGLIPLKADADALTNILRERIRAAVESFFLTFCQAFKIYNAQPSTALHIFLAGNASRSPLVEEGFRSVMADLSVRYNLGDDCFCLHSPRLPDDTRPEALTLKTGVALGLLNTIPGEGSGIVYGDAVQEPDKMCLFTLGIFRRGKLVPVLTRHVQVGQWKELGILREDVTLILGYTTSPRALENGVARGECSEQRLTWPGEEGGHPVFIRSLSANRAEVALDVSPDCPDGRQSRILVLDD